MVFAYVEAFCQGFDGEVLGEVLVDVVEDLFGLAVVFEGCAVSWCILQTMRFR